MSRHNIGRKFVNIEQFSADGGLTQLTKRLFPISIIKENGKDINQISVVGWVDDSSVSVCMACGAPFTITRRRHHCRCCGHLLCGTCSPHRVFIAEFGYQKAQRTCSQCYDETGPSAPQHIVVAGSITEVRRVLVGTKEDGTRSTIGWILDECMDRCMICVAKLDSKGTHCRACGNIVCRDCSPHRMTLTRRSHVGPQPVCLQCFCRLEMQKERQLQETLVTTKEPDTSRPIDIMPETAIPAIIAKNIMCTASAPDTTTGGVTNTAEASSITGDMSPMKELSFGADDSVELMHGWLRQKVNLGWRKRYVVLDQGLMSMYEAEAANPPFGKHLKEAVLLVGAAITPYGEPNKGGGLFARRSSTFGSGLDADDFEATPSSDGTRRRLHIRIGRTKKEIDFEASDVAISEDWLVALRAHGNVADEQTLGGFDSEALSSVMNSAIDDYGEDSRSELSGYSSMSSFTGSFGGSAGANRRRRSSVKRAAWELYQRFLQEACGEVISMAGDVSKMSSKGIYQQRRLILTSKPRLFYLDAAGITVHCYDMHVLRPIADEDDSATVARLRSSETFDVLTSSRRFLFRDRSGCAAAWVRAINDGFDEIDADETRAMRNSITVGNLIESDLVAVDDASAGIYFPIPVTSCKVKRSDGGKVFVNICMHSTLEPDENVLNKHTATEGPSPSANIFDYIVDPKRVARYLSLRLPDGETQESHLERRPIALEAIKLINLQYEHLECDTFVFPMTKGNYRGARESFRKFKRD